MTIARDDTPAADGSPAALITVKAVPGARQDQIVGRLGDRLKIRIGAPPEGGRANDAICRLLAEALGVRAKDVQIVNGRARAEKTVRIVGVTVAAVEAKW